jgi:GntR family transcriptional regulator
MPVDPGAPQPLYRQVAALLRDAIYQGRYPRGSRLTEPELMAEYGVSRVTVRQAIALLREDGLIDAVPGRGTFVREAAPVRLAVSRYAGPFTDAGPFTRACREQGINGRMVLVSVARIPASPDLAVLLGVHVGALLVRRERHGVIDDQPVLTWTGHYPAALVDDTPLASDAFQQAGIYAAMRDAGLSPTSATETLAVGPPTGQETATLGRLPAVIRLTRVTRDQAGTALEALYAVANPDRLTFTYEDLPLPP